MPCSCTRLGNDAFRAVVILNDPGDILRREWLDSGAHGGQPPLRVLCCRLHRVRRLRRDVLDLPVLLAYGSFVKRVEVLAADIVAVTDIGPAHIESRTTTWLQHHVFRQLADSLLVIYRCDVGVLGE